MFRNKYWLLLFFSSLIGFSQVKKVTDTIYVYETVIVHDTIFIEKPLDKIIFDKIIFTPGKNGGKPQLTVVQNNKKTVLAVDSLIVEPKKPTRKPFAKPWVFGAKLAISFNSNSFYNEFNSASQTTFGLGVFIKKTLFHPNFAIGAGFGIDAANATFDFNASSGTSSLNGYYFDENRSPRLFNSLTNKGFRYQFPIQVYWNIKKFTPSIGVLGTICNYEASFISSSGALPLKLDETKTYSAQSFYFGYLAQIEYQLYKQWSVAACYSFAEAKNLLFKNSDIDTFAIARKISQKEFSLGVLYSF